MFKKANRLAKDRDIQKAFTRGRAFFSPFFSIKFLPSNKASRFTVVVSTKVSKKAVFRNRVKRILREHLRKNLGKFKAGDYIISVKPKISVMPEKDILPKFGEAAAKLML